MKEEARWGSSWGNEIEKHSLRTEKPEAGAGRGPTTFNRNSRATADQRPPRGRNGARAGVIGQPRGHGLRLLFRRRCRPTARLAAEFSETLSSGRAGSSTAPCRRHCSDRISKECTGLHPRDASGVPHMHRLDGEMCSRWQYARIREILE